MTDANRELLEAAREMLALLSAKSTAPTYLETIRLRDAVARASE